MYAVVWLLNVSQSPLVWGLGPCGSGCRGWANPSEMRTWWGIFDNVLEDDVIHFSSSLFSNEELVFSFLHYPLLPFHTNIRGIKAPRISDHRPKP